MEEGIGGVSWKKVLVVYHGRRCWWCIMEEGFGGVAWKKVLVVYHGWKKVLVVYH